MVFSEHPYLTLSLTAFLLNIPFGYIRAASPKFSLQWLFWIHASIPLLVYLRMKLSISMWFIPVSIFFAIIGQILGSRLRRRSFTEEDIEKLEQIPDLKVFPRKTEKIDDREIMVVLLNMGGPKTISEVRGFLKRIFCDELIIRFPLSSVLQPIFANGLVALRGKETERRYGLIGGGSPIFKSTLDQTEALAKELNKRGRNLNVIFSFNYSNPLPEETIIEIKSAGKKYILPLSLYPHFSAATTGSNVYYLKKAAARLYPELIFLKSQSYYLADSYVDAFVDRIQEAIGSSINLSFPNACLPARQALVPTLVPLGRNPDRIVGIGNPKRTMAGPPTTTNGSPRYEGTKNLPACRQAFGGDSEEMNHKINETLDDFYLLFSAHGLPLYFLAQGDQYPFEIAQTVAKILDRLGRRHAWVISYQSAVGPMRWLKPSTDAMLKALARRGVKKLLIVPISFVTDHIETLCEIDIEYRALAENLGIKDFRMSKALESHPGFINALANCVEGSLNFS